jgi:hypothetical protein
MAGTPKKRERRERLKSLLQDHEAFDWICARIASGDTLVNFCRELDVPYVAVNEWIQDNEKRRQQYADALAFRETHSKELVISQLTSLLTVDITLAFNPDGSMRPLDEIPEDVRKCIAGLEISEEWGQSPEGDRIQTGLLKKIKFWDKNKAIEMLAKHLKMFVEKHEHTGKDGGPIRFDGKVDGPLRVEFVDVPAPGSEAV